MILNILLGFIIPWVIAFIIIHERKIIYFIAPFASVVSFIVNDFGFYYFWNLYPFECAYISGLPFNLGLFSLYPCIIIQIIRKHSVNPFYSLPITSFILTLVESCGLLVGRVVYKNHWNIVGTFFSYYISLLITYTFYKILKKQMLI